MDRSNQHVFLLFALLLFYALGPAIALGWGIFAVGSSPGRRIEDENLIGVLSTFAANPGAYTSVLHQMIMPVAAAVTAANFTSVLGHRFARWLFIVPLVTIFVCLCDALLFSSLLELETPAGEVGQVSAAGAISQIFLSAAAALATYVMLLVGLQVGAPPEPPPSPAPPAEPEGDDFRGSLAWSAQTDTGATPAPNTPAPSAATPVQGGVG